MLAITTVAVMYTPSYARSVQRWRQRVVETFLSIAGFIFLPVLLLFAAACWVRGRRPGKGGVLLVLLPLWALGFLAAWMFIYEPNSRFALTIWAAVALGIGVGIFVILPAVVGGIVRIRHRRRARVSAPERG